MDQLVESLSTPVSVVIVAAGFLGLLVGWLVGRRKDPEPVTSSSNPEAEPELRWRHEKLVLLERQEAERDARLGKFLQAVSRSDSGKELEVKSRLFGLAESLRDLRQRVGTDLSRLALVEGRLASFEEQGAPRPEALSAAREIAISQIRRLETTRDRLRPVTSETCFLEEDLRDKALPRDGASALLGSLRTIREALAELPSDWHLLTDEADRSIRDLLGAGGEKEYVPIREVLLVDGAATASLRKEDQAPALETVDELIELLEAEPTASVTPLVAKPPVPVAMTPDSAFRPPEGPVPVNGNGKHETPPTDDPGPGAGIDEGEDEGEPETLVVFRANDASVWGKNVYRGANCRARSLKICPGWAEWVSIRRVDTGERVFAPTRHFSFSNADLAASIGFNASNELFYGARHLGMFADSCPNEVETRFTYGGWGFGHRVSETGAAEGALQASGWEGREISPDTVFEIVLHAELPEFAETDRLLEPTRSTVLPGTGGIG